MLIKGGRWAFRVNFRDEGGADDVGMPGGETGREMDDGAIAAFGIDTGASVEIGNADLLAAGEEYVEEEEETDDEVEDEKEDEDEEVDDEEETDEEVEEGGRETEEDRLASTLTLSKLDPANDKHIAALPEPIREAVTRGRAAEPVDWIHEDLVALGKILGNVDGARTPEALVTFLNDHFKRSLEIIGDAYLKQHGKDYALDEIAKSMKVERHEIEARLKGPDVFKSAKLSDDTEKDLTNLSEEAEAEVRAALRESERVKGQVGELQKKLDALTKAADEQRASASEQKALKLIPTTAAEMAKEIRFDIDKLPEEQQDEFEALLKGKLAKDTKLQKEFAAIVEAIEANEKPNMKLFRSMFGKHFTATAVRLGHVKAAKGAAKTAGKAETASSAQGASAKRRAPEISAGRSAPDRSAPKGDDYKSARQRIDAAYTKQTGRPAPSGI